MPNRSPIRITLVLSLASLSLVGCAGDGSMDLDSGPSNDVGPVRDVGFDSVVSDGGPGSTDSGTDAAADVAEGTDAGDVITEIRITPASITLGRGDELFVTARAFNGAGDEVAAATNWSSADPSIATVDASGRVVGGGDGTTSIRAAAGDVIGSASVEVEPLDAYMKNYIEALFLGTGPFTPSDGAAACVTFPGRWAAYPRGTTVMVLASSSLDRGSDGVDTVALLQAAVADVAVATHGAVRAVLAMTAEADPIPERFQATVTDHPDPISTGCAFDRGCVHSEFSDGAFTVIESNRIVLRESLQPADAYVHDTIGHGLMGMCHIDQAAIGGTPLSLMSGGPGATSGAIADTLSPLDIAAARAVYATSLEPGARRADFVEFGLINP